jgi:hypothetical protein
MLTSENQWSNRNEVSRTVYPDLSDCNHHSTGKSSGTNCEVLPELKFCHLGLSLPEDKWLTKGIIKQNTAFHSNCETGGGLISQMECTIDGGWSQNKCCLTPTSLIQFKSVDSNAKIKCQKANQTPLKHHHGLLQKMHYYVYITTLGFQMGHKN